MEQEYSLLTGRPPGQLLRIHDEMRQTIRRVLQRSQLPYDEAQLLQSMMRVWIDIVNRVTPVPRFLRSVLELMGFGDA